MTALPVTIVRTVCLLTIYILPLFAAQNAWGDIPDDANGNVYMLPANCSELLPDSSPYLTFFEAVGRGQAKSNHAFAERIFGILSLRDLLMHRDEKAREANPIDLLIRKTLCFYREKKEPLRPIAYDDGVFVKYMKDSLGDLEKKVDGAIVQSEIARQERLKYEKRLLESEKYVAKVQRQAERDASRKYQRLQAEARRTVSKNK